MGKLLLHRKNVTDLCIGAVVIQSRNQRCRWYIDLFFQYRYVNTPQGTCCRAFQPVDLPNGHGQAYPCYRVWFNECRRGMEPTKWSWIRLWDGGNEIVALSLGLMWRRTWDLSSVVKSSMCRILDRVLVSHGCQWAVLFTPGDLLSKFVNELLWSARNILISEAFYFDYRWTQRSV